MLFPVGQAGALQRGNVGTPSEAMVPHVHSAILPREISLVSLQPH